MIEKNKSNNNNINLKEYNFSNLKFDAAVRVIEKRRYSKIVWLEYLLNNIWQYFFGGRYIFMIKIYTKSYI
jgi:hypothetical protein